MLHGGADEAPSSTPAAAAAAALLSPLPPIASSPAIPAPSSDVEVVETHRPKRRKLQASVTGLIAPPSTSSRPEVVIPVRRRPPRPLITATPPPTSPAFSFTDLEPTSGMSSTSRLGPPSTLGASRSVPDFSATRLHHENNLLRAQLTAARRRLEQEQAQFAAERQAYEEYIQSLKGDMNVE